MPSKPTCPLSREQVIDRYFLEHRARLIDLAAFLDRIDRAQGEAVADRRVAALRQAIQLLDDGKPERARRILELFSDLTTDPIDKAAGKGAIGVAINRFYDETRA
ncbi:MAG: hypothetical protein RLN76_04340 [Phycisphaeraceae bacterium]